VSEVPPMGTSYSEERNVWARILRTPNESHALIGLSDYRAHCPADTVSPPAGESRGCGTPPHRPLAADPIPPPPGHPREGPRRPIALIGSPYPASALSPTAAQIGGSVRVLLDLPVTAHIAHDLTRAMRQKRMFSSSNGDE